MFSLTATCPLRPTRDTDRFCFHSGTQADRVVPTQKLLVTWRRERECGGSHTGRYLLALDMLLITATHLPWPRAHRRPRSGHQDCGRESRQPLQHLVPQLGSAPVPLLLLCPVIELHASVTHVTCFGLVLPVGILHTHRISFHSLPSICRVPPSRSTPRHRCIPLCHLPLPTHSVSTQSNQSNQKPAHPLGIPQCSA